MSTRSAENNRPLASRLSTRWYNSRHFDPNDKWAGFEPKSSAIVLVDMINWQAHRDGATALFVRENGLTDQIDYFVRRCERLVVPALARVLATARRIGLKVVHARLASRSEDYADMVPAFQSYARAAEAFEGSWSASVVDGLYNPSDISVIKSASGAYNSSDLDRVFSNLGIRTVFYSGVVTDACVLLTAAAGFDLGYQQYLLTDCTAAFSDNDQEAAERIMNKYIAQTVTAAETIAEFEKYTVA